MDQSPKTPAALSTRRKLVFSLLLLFLLAAALEIGLRAAGVLEPPPLFTEFRDDRGRDRVRVNFNPIHDEFDRAKSPGVLRIMIAGGSTALGFPYQPRSSFGFRLQALLGESLPEQPVEIIHLGKVAMYSGEVAEVVDQALRYEPDLLIVYSGQNEFISLPTRPGPVKGLLLRLRSVQVLGGAAAALLGSSRESLMRGWEEDPEAGLADRSLNPISRADYERAIREHRENLARIARAAKKAQVPLVLSTMVSNLRDWPPELGAFPAGMSEEGKEQARADYDRAMAEIDQGQAAAAVAELDGERAQFPGYGALTFARGRARTALLLADLKSGDTTGDTAGEPIVLDPGEERRLALADFKEAVAEEARATPSHRATPEQNAMIREVAKSFGAWLLDAEDLFDRSSYLAPGFDWFDDHCHPNLFGQQVLAEALLELMQDHAFPVAAGRWRPPPPWNEDAFRQTRDLDQPFLHRVDLYLATYLGLNRFFPRRSAAIHERLERAEKSEPDDPLPLLLEALVAMNYPGPDESFTRLAELHRDRPDDLAKAMKRYTTSLVDLRQGVFMVRLHRDLDLAPFTRLLRSGVFQEEQETGQTSTETKGVAFYHRFIDLDAGAQDVTGLVEQGVKAMDLTERSEVQFVNEETAKVLFPSPGAGVFSMAHGVKYRINSGQAFLSTGPIRIVPGKYDELVVEVSREGDLAGEMVLSFAFNGWDGSRGFGEIPVTPDADGHFAVHCWDYPRWAMAREVIEMRLRPNLKSGVVTLKALGLLNAAP